MKTKAYRILTLALLATALGLAAGCGGGSSSSSSSSTPSNTTTNTTPPVANDFAPSGVGGKTLHAHIAGTSTNWELRFRSGNTSGNYTHFENGVQLENGTYTYSKTSAKKAVITTMPNGGAVAATIQLTFTAPGSGTYNIVQFPETGTFSF